MSTTTTNLELVKPAGNERVDVDVINGNYDKIDEFAGLAITDANYVHTDNNYTTTEKDKLSAIQPNATATSFTQTLVSGTAVGTITINGTSYTIYAPTASGGASALNDLTDVTLASPSNGQVLKYNSTTGKWENANESGGGGGYIPTGESYRFNLDGSVASSNLALSVQWTDGESTQVAWVCTYSQISTGWTTGDYKNITINWDSSNQNFNFVAKSGSFECNESYFDEGDTMGTLASGNITFLAVEKTEVSVDWTQVQLSGTKIAEIEIDGVSQNVYAPTPPTKTSDLNNDSNFVADASYVHTDNNYTTTEKNKLSGLVEVEANPSGTASTDLTKIAIGGTNYNIPSGGSGSSTFAGLSDVDIDDTTLANGQVPVWNSTTEKWENGAGGGGTTVVPNPQGTPTGELLAIQIGNDIYSLPEGESEHLLNDILTGPDATKATASSTSQDGAIWKAFDGVKTGTEQSCWIPEYGSTNCWICYHFATPKYITKCHVYFYENMSGTYTGAVKIQGSNDGETWTDISQSQALSMTRGVHDYEIESTDIVNGYSYVRMFSETALVVYGSASACTLELEIYGRDNASGTTVIPNPEGEATDTLTKIQIGNDIYSLPQGGSGGGSSIPAYSTNETSYCAWIDGTTVYQKTFTVDGDGTTREFTVQTGITNGKRLINAQVAGLRWDSASRWWAPCYINIDNFSWSTHFSLNSDFSEFVVKAAQFPLKNITVTLYYTKTDDIPYHGGGGGYTEVTGTLVAGETSVSLSDKAINNNSTFDGPYTTVFGVNPTNMVVTSGVQVLQEFVTQESELSGTVTVSSTFSTYPAWKAFLDSTVDGWVAEDSDTAPYLEYEFPSAVRVDEITWYTPGGTRESDLEKVQYSLDGTTWIDCTLSTNESNHVEIEDAETAQYWKMIFADGPYSQYMAPMVSKLQFISVGVGTLILTFPAQSENIGVKVRVS